MSNVNSKTEIELNEQGNVRLQLSEARVRRLLADLDATNNIDDREDLLSRQLANLDVTTRCAYVRSIASDAFEQSQDLCFILSQLSVAMAGTKFCRELNKSIHEVNEILEHLSITGGEDEEDVIVPDAGRAEKARDRVSSSAEGAYVAEPLRMAKLNVAEKIAELHEAIEELGAAAGSDLIVDVAMMSTNALADHLEGNSGAQTSLKFLAERLAGS